MRPSYVILIIFAVQVQKCEAGLFDWISNTWNSVKTSVVNWVDKAVVDVKKWVKKALEDVNEKLGEMFAPARKFAEDNWDCGADIMWFTKFFAKMVTITTCREIMTEVNDACKMHDRCYSERKHSRVTCDLVFCEKLYALKEKLPRLSLCGVPEMFCHHQLYTGFMTHPG
ncbi:hypothetical protein RB195_008672 [Necator americanus]|uniref:Uncharacterized protein n=1 Tax=Necator americanus TaxID=51031 RepID=A0ABR1CPR8_NECAM